MILAGIIPYHQTANGLKNMNNGGKANVVSY